jgi:hypothetical protein
MRQFCVGCFDDKMTVIVQEAVSVAEPVIAGYKEGNAIAESLAVAVNNEDVGVCVST